jgi:hypothetical protein
MEYSSIMKIGMNGSYYLVSGLKQKKLPDSKG